MIVQACIIEHLDRGNEEMEGSDLISMPTELEKSNFRYQIPQNNVRISRATCKTYTGAIKGKMGDGRFVAIE